MIAPDVSGLLAALASERAHVRFTSAKALCECSAIEPGLVYRHFDRIAGLLRQPNRILQWNGMRILANLAPVDRAGRIDAMLDEFLAPITGPAMINAAHAMEGGAKIALAKPYLAAPIAQQILLVEHTTFARPECCNVAIGHALKALERIAPLLEDRRAVKEFAARQLENPRPATRRKAERLLGKLGKAAAAKAR